MNDETRTALIELWRDVPETRPTGVYPSATIDGFWDTISDRNISLHAESLSRDAITEWLCRRDMRHMLPEFSDNCHDDYKEGWVVDSQELADTYPTRLSALIAAARAVHKGAERGE